MIKIRFKLLAAFFFSIILLGLSSLIAILYGERLVDTINSTSSNKNAVKDIVLNYNYVNSVLVLYSISESDRLPALDHEYEFSMANIRTALDNFERTNGQSEQINTFEKMYSETKDISEKIFSLHKEEKKRNLELSDLLMKLRDKRYELKSAVASGSLDIKMSNAMLGYEEKEFVFQYKDKKHSLEWLESIESARGLIKKEHFSEYLPMMEDYSELANKVIEEIFIINDLEVQQQYFIAHERNNFTENSIALTKINNANENELQVVLDNGKNRKTVALLLFIVSFACGSLIVFVVSRGISKSAEELANVAKKVSVGNLRQRANIQTKDEIGYLAEVFNKMLDNLEKMNRKLREDQGEIKAIISSMGEGLLVMDMEFKIVLLNKTAENLLGISAEEAKGKHVTKLLTVLRHKIEIPYKEWPTIRMLKSGRAVNVSTNDDIYYKTAAGRIFPVEATTAPFIRKGIKGVIVVFKDVSDVKSKNEELEYSRKNLENALQSIYIERDNVQEEKNKLSAILNSIGEAVLAVDEEQRVIIFNQVAEKITGFSFANIKGKKYSDILKFLCQADEREKTDFIDILSLSGGSCPNNNISLLAKEKHLISTDISAAPIKDHEGENMGHIIVFRDVTEKREMERMRSDFISLVSHQLRTPLASMKWFLEILLNGDVGKLKPKQMDVVRETYDNNQNMIDFINQMLNVSRIESNRLAMIPISLKVNDAITGIIQETTPLLEAKKQKIKFIGLKEKALEIKTDKNLLRNIISSLISNASRYSPDGGKIVIEAAKQDKDYLLFKISDDGIGIPKKEQLKIFKKFSRATNAIVYEANGSGLGLYIVKSILDMMGGKIWFESVEGKGSTFFFLLPIDNVFCEINGSSGKKPLI